MHLVRAARGAALEAVGTLLRNEDLADRTEAFQPRRQIDRVTDSRELAPRADLAQKGRMPQKFLEAILLELKNQGVLQSKKGKGGGYALSQAPESITLGRVIRAMEGPLAPLPCASETAFHACEECPDPETCETRMVMKEVRDATAKILDRTTLADACRRGDAARVSAQTADGLMYYI